MFNLPDGIRENNPGMLSDAEAEKLAELAAGKVVLELGSYTGLSTIVMARVAAHVISCDWHFGDQHIGKTDTLAKLDANLRRFNVREKVTMIVGRFERTLPLLSRCCDMAFIDGAHDFESVRHDTIHARRHLRPSDSLQCMVWHDIDQAEVRRAVIEAGGAIANAVGRLGWIFV